MSRSRIRAGDVNTDPQQQPQQQQRNFGSLGSMEVHRVNRVRERSWESDRVHRVQVDQSQALNRSWDIDKVPGLDRNWQLEQARGLELVYRSMEKEKERRLQAAQNTAHGHRQKEGKKKKRKRDKSKESQAMMEQIDNNKLSQERLERRIDELNRMLLEEKHQNRKDKLAVAKLQQEVARQKSDRSIRESQTLMKELERERMLREKAERRLQSTTMENENYKSRFLALQEEFKKMDTMARTMLQFKNKVDQLKQEKATLSINYEKNMQKFRTEISNSEHENKIVSAELKRLETQCNNCQHCNKDLSYRVTKVEPGQSESSDKVKMLLERLKRLEEEKSQLVLENENQRQQYEKCLDEIANQVVQALLSQKGLREECGKLQKRVLDLEDQNRQLKDMFHQRIKFASDSLLQGRLEGVQSDQSLQQTKFAMFHGLTGSCDSITPLSQISLGSLQSICSNYHETSHNEGSDPGKHKPISPPSWLRDQVLKTDSPSSSVCSPATIETMLPLTHKQGHLTTQRSGTSQGGGVAGESTAPYVQYPPPGENRQNAKLDGAKFHGQKVISHNAAQSAFHSVGGQTSIPASQGGQNNGEAAVLTNQIPPSDQAHLHMMHMQNMAMYHQRQNSLQAINPLTSSSSSQIVTSSNSLVTSSHNLVTSSHNLMTSCSQSPVISSSPDLTSRDGTYVTLDCTKELSSISDVDLKLINSIQNAKKRFSQGRTLHYEQGAPCNGINGGSQIETEFPADNTSPKMKHTCPPGGSHQQQHQHSRQNSWDTLGDKSEPVPESVNRRNEAQADALNGKFVPKPVKLTIPTGQKSGQSETSPGKQLLKMSDSFNDKFTLNNQDGMPKIGDFLDSDSDDSDSSRPLSNKFSMASTMSLNELLEKGLENVQTPMDENFSIDNFQIFDSDEDEGDFKDPMERMKLNFAKENDGATTTVTSPQTYTNKNGDKFIIKKNEQSEKDYGDYVCLRKIREYIYMNMPEVKEEQKSQQNKCSHNTEGGDCKSSQTSPHLEELCHCGSCDELFKSHDKNDPLNKPVSVNSSRSNSRSSFSRPSELHLSSTMCVDSVGKKDNGELQSNCRTRSVDSDIALKSSYHDYVNLSPEMVQQILSRDSTPQKDKVKSSSSCKSTTPVKSSSNYKTPPPVKPKPHFNLNNDSGICESHNTSKMSCDVVLTNDCGSSGDSPDSAMQRSYTSTTSSENRRSLEQLKYGKDEGYSSNSANSVKTDSISDMLSSNVHESKKMSSEVTAQENCNNNSSANIKQRKDTSTSSPDRSNNKVHVSAEVHAHYEKPGGSLTSLHSISSVESEFNAKKVKDIKDYFEHKMEEVRVSMDTLDSPQVLRKSFRNVPKTSPFHHRPQSCYGSASKLATPGGHRSSSLIPKPCLIKHTRSRSHSMSCVIKMAKLTRDFNSRVTLRRSNSLSNLNQDNIQAPILENVSNHQMAQGQTRSKTPPKCGYINGNMKPMGKSMSGTSCKLQHSHVPNKTKMGLSSRRKSESDEKRIVGEGSETGYRSREELRAEGVVIQKYEEEGSVVQYNNNNPIALQLHPPQSKPNSQTQKSTHKNTNPKTPHKNTAAQKSPYKNTAQKTSHKHSFKHLKKTFSCFGHKSSDEGSSLSLAKPISETMVTTSQSEDVKNSFDSAVETNQLKYVVNSFCVNMATNTGVEPIKSHVTQGLSTVEAVKPIKAHVTHGLSTVEAVEPIISHVTQGLSTVEAVEPIKSNLTQGLANQIEIVETGLTESSANPVEPDKPGSFRSKPVPCGNGQKDRSSVSATCIVNINHLQTPVISVQNKQTINNNKPAVIVNKNDPVENLIDQTELDLSGISSHLEDSVELLSSIGILPDDLLELEKQYNIMQQNLKDKMSEGPTGFGGKSKSLDFNEFKSGGKQCSSLGGSQTHQCLTSYNNNSSCESPWQHITHINCLKERYATPELSGSLLSENCCKSVNDVCCKSSNDVCYEKDDITAQIECLSKTVDDLQRSLSSLSVDTLVSDDVSSCDDTLKEDGTSQLSDNTGSKVILEEKETMGGDRIDNLMTPEEDVRIDNLMTPEDNDRIDNLMTPEDDDKSGPDECDIVGIEGSDINDAVNNPDFVSLHSSGKTTSKTSSFLSTLVMLSSSDDEEDEADSDALWDSLEGSIHSNGESSSRDDSYKRTNHIPLSFFSDLSPSPTLPDSSVICLSDDSPHYNHSGGVTDIDVAYCCTDCGNVPYPYYSSKRCETCCHSDLSGNETIVCDVCDTKSQDETIDCQDSVNNTESYEYSHCRCRNNSSPRRSDKTENKGFAFPKLSDPPRNKRILELQEESRIEQETNIQRLSNAYLESTSCIYKTVLSNTLSESSNNESKKQLVELDKAECQDQNDWTKSFQDHDLIESLHNHDLVESLNDHDLVKSFADHDFIKAHRDHDLIKSCNDHDLDKSFNDHDLVKSLNDHDVSQSLGDHPKLCKLNSIFCNQWSHNSFESTESSVGLDGLSLSDSYCDSTGFQDSE